MSIDLGSRAELERALILGLARQPLSVPDELTREDVLRSRLGYLALVAARQRFARPEPPTAFARPEATPAPARYLGWHSRARLRGLFGDRSSRKRRSTDTMTLRVRDALQARGISLHPFDVPILQSFLRVGELEHDVPFDPLAWRDLPPNDQARALAALRRTDPEAARSICAAEIGAHTAAVRGKWLAALETGLGPDDVELLEAQLNDRASSVVERATELLARVPGTRWYEDRLAEACSRLTKKTGLLRRQARLELEAPLHLQNEVRWGWVRTSFATVAPTALAASFDLPIEQLPRAIDDPDLRRALYLAAIEAHDAPLAEAFSSTFEAVDPERILQRTSTARGPAAWDEAQRDLAARTLLPACVIGDPLQCYGHAIRFYEALRRPLPAQTATHLLAQAHGWERRFHECVDPDQALLALLAWLTVLPASARPRAIEAAALPASHRREALDYCTLLEEIETRD
ncbi:MAG: DUF5691 domain-containing protein [Planctomycetota bacterium]